MPRARHAPATRKRHRKVLKQAKGFWGGRHRLYRPAAETVMRGMAFATRDRKTRRRALRSLWIVRISAACKEEGLSYSRFISALKKAGVALDRKQLAEICVNDSAAFKELVKIARQQAKKAA